MNKKLIFSLALTTIWPSLHAMKAVKKLFVGTLFATISASRIGEHNAEKCNELNRMRCITCDALHDNLAAHMTCKFARSGNECSEPFGCAYSICEQFHEYGMSNLTKLERALKKNNCQKEEAADCFAEFIELTNPSDNGCQQLRNQIHKECRDTIIKYIIFGLAGVCCTASIACSCSRGLARED